MSCPVLLHSALVCVKLLHAVMVRAECSSCSQHRLRSSQILAARGLVMVRVLTGHACLRRTRSPAKEAPECKGRREVLPIVKAVDHTECVWDGHPQTLAELVQILLFRSRPGAQCQYMKHFTQPVSCEQSELLLDSNAQRCCAQLYQNRYHCSQYCWDVESLLNAGKACDRI